MRKSKEDVGTDIGKIICSKKGAKIAVVTNNITQSGAPNIVSGRVRESDIKNIWNKA